MGLGGISVWQLGIILLIVMLIFGTKRIRQLGEDVGAGIKGFKKEVGTTDGLADDLIDGAKTVRRVSKAGKKAKDILS
jgi:TatA/E family protein of Tat protein translocase